MRMEITAYLLTLGWTPDEDGAIYSPDNRYSVRILLRAWYMLQHEHRNNLPVRKMMAQGYTIAELEFAIRALNWAEAGETIPSIVAEDAQEGM